ncbi:FAD:protein FMN transferase [Rubritalea spongiae]|uniref:FAD:protein FMN transferase n=1 Tax=Rubritalea spongiae TaxID=430797 RepID=A0ABW5DXY5_9BACT
MQKVSRRVFLQGFSVFCVVGCGRKLEAVDLIDHHWSGIGFGIPMSAELYQFDPASMKSLRFEELIQQLELAFSLYNDASEVSVLNRERVLRDPSAVFLKVLELARELSVRTEGYYQPAIHKAWMAMEEGELSDAMLAAATMDNVAVSEAAVRLRDPLIEVSFNALIQGYLTDHVAQHLRTLGVKSALLHFGESYGVGQHPEQRPWELAVMGTPVGEQVDLVGTMRFEDAGLAVSTHDSTRKLLNPKRGEAQIENRVVAVVSEEGAAVADAFATAFTVAPSQYWPKLYQNLIVRRSGAVKIWEENTLVFEA